MMVGGQVRSQDGESARFDVTEATLTSADDD